MKTCFEDLISKGEKRPVIVALHVPLHYTARTSSRHNAGYTGYYMNCSPKEETEGVDFAALLDSFDPSVLDWDVIETIGARNSFLTGLPEGSIYDFDEGDLPPLPAEMRLRIAKRSFDRVREEMIKWEERYRQGRENAYKNCRRLMISAIGNKVAEYIVQKEIDSSTPAQLLYRQQEYERWEQECRESWDARNAYYEEQDYGYYEYSPVSISDKIVRARKGIRIKNGRALTQREFARLLDYPASKYERAERYDEEVDWALLDKLIRIAHINPYWLLDDECPAYLGDFGGAGVAMGVEPAILVGLDIVYKWVREGCPRETWWMDTYE